MFPNNPLARRVVHSFGSFPKETTPKLQSPTFSTPTPPWANQNNRHSNQLPWLPGCLCGPQPLKNQFLRRDKGTFLNSKQHTHRHFFMLSTMMSSHGFSRNHLSTLKDQRVETTCHRHRTPARYLEDNSITFNTVLQLPYSEPNGCRLSPFSQPNQHRNYAKISRTPLKTTVFFSFAFFGYAFQNDLLAWVKGRSTK